MCADDDMHFHYSQKKLQLGSGLQELHMMKLNDIPCSSKHDAIDNKANDSHFHSVLLNSEGKFQVFLSIYLCIYTHTHKHTYIINII